MRIFTTKDIDLKIKGETMHTVIVHIQVKENMVVEFIQATIKNVQGSMLEKEIASFDFLQSKEDPTKFLLIEVYKNEASVASHQQTSHYLIWKEAVNSMMKQPRMKMAYSNVFPKDMELNE
jgi:autoinducer 2-degrading protein